MRFFLFLSIYLFSGCSSVSRNLWLNKFEVCCIIKTEVFRNDNKLDFKDNFYQDKHVKLNFDYELLSGIKIKIKTECIDIAYIDWNKAYYIDEYGNKKDVVIYENATILEKSSNISFIPPYTDFEINIIPKDYIKKEKNIVYFKQMLDPNLRPDDLKGKNTQLNFSFNCNDEIYNYRIYFHIRARYNKDI